jgi:hypothetical protein
MATQYKTEIADMLLSLWGKLILFYIFVIAIVFGKPLYMPSMTDIKNSIQSINSSKNKSN